MWSSCAANSHLLRTDELRVSHHFVTVHTAYAAGSWNCQTCICSPAGAWAVSYFTCTLGACIWIKKICIEFSLILWNSRWSLHGTVKELWRPGGHGFLKSYCFGSWWEAKCLWFWHFHHHEGALMGRVYSRTHFPLQCIFPPSCSPERPHEQHLLCPIDTQIATSLIILWWTSERRNFHISLAAPLLYRWMGFKGRRLNAQKSWDLQKA